MNKKFSETKAEMVDRMRRKKLFYDVADATIQFKDGTELKVNKAILAYHIKGFQDIFYDSNGQAKDVSILNITDVGPELFKLFLDCVLGFKELNVDDVLQIYGLVLKYDLVVMKNECAKLLMPTSMNEDTPKVLKLSLSYDDCIDLRNACLATMKAYGIKKVFSEDKYYLSLDPETAYMLLDSSNEFDKEVVLGLLKWGNFWLENQEKPCETMRDFLEKTGMLDKLSSLYDKYDDPTDFIQFYKTSPLKDIYTEEEVFAFSGKMWKNLRKKKNDYNRYCY